MSADYYGDDRTAEREEAAEMAAEREDDPYEGTCRRCGYDDPCGCPADINTMSLMRCPSCGGKWWRGHGDDSARCLHRSCGKTGSVVEREPLYPPHDEKDSADA